MACKTIDDQFWNDPDIVELKADEKLLLIFLMTNQHAHYTGIYYLPISLLEEEIGTSIKDIEKVMKGLSLRNLIKYDYSAKVVWVKIMKLQKNFSKTQIEGLKCYFGKICHSSLLIEFLNFHQLYDMMKYFVKSKDSESDEFQYLGPIDPDSLTYSQKHEDFHKMLIKDNIFGALAGFGGVLDDETCDDSLNPPVAEAINIAAVAPSAIYRGIDTPMGRGSDGGIDTPIDSGIQSKDSEDGSKKEYDSNILINNTFGASDDTPIDRGIDTPMCRGSKTAETQGLSSINNNDEGRKNEGLYISSNNNINSNNINRKKQKETVESKNRNRSAKMKKNDSILEKKQYAEFVLLKEEEYQKLVKNYGKHAVEKMIEILNTYKGAHGKKYKSDYMAILNWVVDAYEKREKEHKKRKPEKEHYYDYKTPWNVEYF